MNTSEPFIPLHFADKLHTVNPFGTIGIVTLWSRVDYILRLLRTEGVDLHPESSPLAVVGTLYGNGLRELLRNLLYNPQIDTLLFFGRNRSGSAEELRAFFEQGIVPEPVEHIRYGVDSASCPLVPMRIQGTGRLIDNMVSPESFERTPRLVHIGEAQDPAEAKQIAAFLRDYQPCSGPVPARRQVGLPRVQVASHPCNPRQHTVCAQDPLSAWKELIFRLHRFGIPVRLAKGERRELQNMKVIVEEPAPVPVEELERWGFSPAHLSAYQRDILNGVLQPDETYTYGNRLRSHFGVDAIEEAARRLCRDPEDRKSYMALWDQRRDLTASGGHPCLVSLFFRPIQGRLTLTAAFRTHNALDAWPVNFYGLMAILDAVAQRTGMTPGSITVFSHSITLDTKQMDRASLIASEARFQYREDPMGYFRITVDGGAIHVEHRFGDVTLNTYCSPKASRIQHELYRDCAISDISHAIYMGRQLARAEACLQNGLEFVQE